MALGRELKRLGTQSAIYGVGGHLVVSGDISSGTLVALAAGVPAAAGLGPASGRPPGNLASAACRS